MGAREALNDHPYLTYSGLSTVVLVAMAFVWSRLVGGGLPSHITRCYYTVDDGKSWFADDIDRPYPFDHGGKLAYRIYVYRCDDRRAPFATHIERYSDAALKQLALLGDRKGQDKDLARESIAIGGLEAKKPNDPNAKWVREQSRAGLALTTPKCPDGSDERVSPVFP